MLIKKDILSTLAYFDIFQYPLTVRETFLFLSDTFTSAEFYTAVDELLNDGTIYKSNGFISLHPGNKLATRRIEGNKKAKDLMKTAEKVASILARFPFVRGVGISGSLSKNYADETSDIDLFIITAANRLWIARTIMHLFKKATFLFKKQHLFCMNYYVDEDALEIQEKNIYTAIEVVTLIPLKGNKVFANFYNKNSWTKTFLPNNYMRISTATNIERSFLKEVVEALLTNFLGNMIDDMLRKITANRWMKKSEKKKLNSRGIIMSMKASKHFAKPDPTRFQYKLLDTFDKKLKDLTVQHECLRLPAQ